MISIWLSPLRLKVLLALAVSMRLGSLLAQQTNSQADSEAILAMSGRRNLSVHDPSTIVKCKNEYWLFATGNGIVSKHSPDLVNWTNGPRVFTNSPSWVRETVPGNYGHFWAPDVIHLTNAYFLYYSVSTFGKNTSAIALATNPTLDPADPNFAWTDRGVVIQSSPREDYNTIDPAITQDADGNLWLAFGSFWGGIKLIQLDPATGKQISAESEVYSLAHYSSIEASYIHRHEGYYYLFVDWGMCCRGMRSTYNIRVGRSQKITGPYLDKDGVDMLMGGGSLVLGTTAPFIGPGHAGIISEGGTNWFSCHFYDGTRRGAPTLAVRPMHWEASGWPEVDLMPAK